MQHDIQDSRPYRRAFSIAEYAGLMASAHWDDTGHSEERLATAIDYLLP